MNTFGGNWTKIKIEILVKYAKAYLTIMDKRRYYHVMYFDGFAGSGFIVRNTKFGQDITVGAARSIIAIDEPRSFDSYYFVEKDPKKFKRLKENTQDAFPLKKGAIHAVCEDCNKKLVDLANYLRNPKNKNVKTLAFIDPCGMQVEWRTIENLKGLSVDMWILVPTGLGVNRLLKNNGQISEAWFRKLELFLGLSRHEIETRFYRRTATLFDDIEYVEKERNAINNSAILYRNRLSEVFKYVTPPYELKNSSNAIMYHLFLASNNPVAVKIGTDIIKDYK